MTIQTQTGGPAEPTVEIVEQRTCYQGFFRMEHYRLRHRRYDGGMSPLLSRELFERGHAAAVLPYDPVLDRIVLLEQFRIGALDAPGGPWLLEIVAGIIESGETAAEVVEREMLEEAGCTLLALEPICEYLVSPGGTSERISLYCGRVDAAGVGGIHGLAAEGEDIRVFTVTFAEAMALLSSGRINSASPIIALQWLQLNRSRLQQLWSP
ncbi:NUDIX domain-containing protein [Sulfurivermis fontis]|uniref:NUDIX domain-containing protein n=1 Tax=Sulfurivermis fontis TaxID=1972068 RepID=UPI001E550E88|nr:NUDIX domain-containing protein [Sulfurivermis fontis]